ncbi:MAG: transporter [Alphaproteobacteria bacterium]|nr:transporter [Alphaproteobacteria bacterium]
MKVLQTAGLLACILIASTPALAQESCHEMTDQTTHHNHSAMHSAPIGVMREHMHGAGKWMASYRFKHMAMDGLRDGTRDISAESAVTNYANPNAPPSTFRVAPTEMSMDMHMLGVMYGVTDWLTVMGMGTYLKKEMKSITFSGMSGTTPLGTNTVKTSGFGDSNIVGLVRLYNSEMHHLHAQAGMSAPTGSITKRGEMLTPMNTRMNMRLAYGMQLGSGTWDFLPGLTYTGQNGPWGWGTQYQGFVRLESENDEGYRQGNKHMLTGWATYAFKPYLEGHARLQGEYMGKIHGRDAQIVSPMTGSDPDNYGGRLIDAGLGLTFKPKIGQRRNNRLGLEVTAPIYQNLNGPQLKRDWSITVGWGQRF